MGDSKTKTVGGGPAVGLADDFTQWLQQGLTTGQFGGISPGGATMGANPPATTTSGITRSNTLFGFNPGVARAAAADSGRQPVNADPSAGLTAVINDILSQGAGKVGGDIKKLIETQQARDVGDLRARYSIGGTGAGTPSAYAEGLYRANAAPQAGLQISQLQLQTLLPILQMIYGLSGKGIPQASTLVEPSGFSKFMSGLGGLASGAGGLLTGVGALKGA